MTYNGLPVFNIKLNEDDETQGMSVVSIVDDPAVCQSLFCFSKEEKKPMMFVDEQKEKHCITSVAILADTPIYRVDYESGDGYYVVFEKQTIRDLVEKYSKDNYNNLVSFQHNGEIVSDFIMLESYFVDKEKGIAPTQFDVPDGSWIVTYKCTNNETWEMVKNELSTGGYSIEILCDIEPAPDTQEIFDEPEPLYDEDEEFMNWLDELLKALDEAGCEVIMSSDKDKWLVNGDGEYWLDEKGNKVPAKCPKCGADVGVYIKGEPVFLCSECGEYLGTVKFPDDEMFSVNIKKKIELSSEEDDEDGLWSLNFDRVERTDILPLVDNKKSAIIDGTEYWVKGIGKERSKDVAICYDPAKHKYVVLPLDTIKQFEPTNHATGQFPPLPKSITDDDDITVQRTVNSGSYADLMHNRTVVMLSYDDEQPQPHTGFRQCAIVAWGETKRGNECLRIYEMYGDSRSAADGTGFIPDYRLILTRRIKSFKPMYNTQPWGIDLLDSRYNWFGDNSMSVCYDHVSEADFNN